MKNNILKYGLTLVTGASLLLGTGCKKLEDFGDLNNNPLGATTPITSALITSGEIGLLPLISSAVSGGVRTGLYAQYFSETQYTETSLYSEPKIDYPSFAGALMDLQVVINRNSDPATAAQSAAYGSNANQIATARILKAYYFWTLTDRWGDLPYSQALKGAANLFPVYDKQEDIYIDLFKELREAENQFDAGPTLGSADIIYQGDVSSWKKLANTLRMLIAIRLTKVYPNAGQLAATEFASAATDVDGFIMDNADNLTLTLTAGEVYRQPWFDLYNGRSDYALSKTLSDILNNMADTRRNVYGTSGAAFPYGLVRDDAVSLPTSYAKVLADPYRTSSAPVVIVNAASSLLAYAEGIERGWTSGDAEQAYNDGVRASFTQWGLSVTNANSVLAGTANYQTGVGGGTGIGSNPFGSVIGQDAITNNPLERIALQRYLAHYLDGIQAWSEWRRTGIPRLVPSVYAVNSGIGIPRRFVYGANEYSTNTTNVTEAAGRLTGGDVANARMWWDR